MTDPGATEVEGGYQWFCNLCNHVSDPKFDTWSAANEASLEHTEEEHMVEDENGDPTWPDVDEDDDEVVEW